MYMAVIAAVNATFPEPGFAMGLVTAGSALGQMVAGPALKLCRTQLGWAETYRSVDGEIYFETTLLLQVPGCNLRFLYV